MTLSPAARKSLVRVVKIAVVAVSFAYVFRVLYVNFDGLRDRQRDVQWWPLVASLPFAVLYQVGRATVWHLMIRRMVGAFPYLFDALAWIRSLAGKYIPGRVFNYLGRVGSYRGLDAPVWKLSLTYLLETYCSALASFVIFGVGILMMRDHHLSPAWFGWAVVAVVVMAVGSHPFFLKLVVKLWATVTKKPREPLTVRWGDFWLWLVMYVVNWLVLGVGFYVLSRTLSDVPLSQLLYLTGAFGVAGWFGMILSVAPSGLGVREGVLVTLLIPILPNGEAAALTLLSRLWITAGEALCFGLAMLVTAPAAREARTED